MYTEKLDLKSLSSGIRSRASSRTVVASLGVRALRVNLVSLEKLHGLGDGRMPLRSKFLTGNGFLEKHLWQYQIVLVPISDT